MSTEAPVPAATAPETTPKKATSKKVAASTVKPKKVKKPAAHPTYGEMIKEALIHLKEKKGSSRAAILKFILQNYKVGDNLTVVNSHLRQALKRGVTSNALKQVRGTGASGSFQLAQRKPAEKVKKVMKPKAKKATTKKAAKESATKPKTPKKKVQKKPAKAAAGKTKTAKKAPAKAKKVTKAKPAKKMAKPKTKKAATTKSKKA